MHAEREPIIVDYDFAWDASVFEFDLPEGMSIEKSLEELFRQHDSFTKDSLKHLKHTFSMRNMSGFWAIYSNATNGTSDRSVLATAVGSISSFFSNAFGSIGSVISTIFSIVVIISVFFAFLCFCICCQKMGCCFVLKYFFRNIFSWVISGFASTRNDEREEEHPLAQRHRLRASGEGPIKKGGCANHNIPRHSAREAQPLMGEEEVG
jgi:hypothetical protein